MLYACQICEMSPVLHEVCVVHLLSTKKLMHFAPAQSPVCTRRPTKLLWRNVGWSCPWITIWKLVPALTTYHIMHYTNLTQPHEICIFLGQMEEEEWPDPPPPPPPAKPIGLQVEEAMTSAEIDIETVCPLKTPTFPPGTHEYDPKKHSLIEGVSKCMITREEAQAKFKEYRDAQGPHDEVYTDGSKINERVGAAVVINRHFQNGETTCHQLSKRLPNNSTIFAAEATAITLALNYYRHMDPVQHDVVIYSDSMSCLQAIEGEDTNNPLICQILNLLWALKRFVSGFHHNACLVFCQSKFNICVRCDMAFIEPMHRNKPNITYLLTYLLWALSDKGTCVRFCWVPSHCGIEGNEIVDHLAKETLDHDIDPLTTVHFADLKPLVNSYIQQEVQIKWDVSIHSRDLYLLKPALGPPKRFRHLTRPEEVVITRLWIGHTKATKSHILSRVPQTACQHCGQTLTTEHILLECTVLQQSRDEYYTVDSLRTFFETIPEICIIEFLREAGFYYLIWMARYPTQLFIKSVTNWRHSHDELLPTTKHHH